MKKITMAVVIFSLCISPVNTSRAVIYKKICPLPYKIQEAIDRADDGDTVFVPEGVYKGEGNKNLDFNGKSIVVMSVNGPENTIIDCENSGSGFYFHSGENSDAIVRGISIINGYGAPGGGFRIEGADPSIFNCVVLDAYRSGIDCENSSVHIESCLISGCESALGGGGIYFYNCTSSVTDCEINSNKTKWDGGGICNYFGSSIITGCVISDNEVSGYDYAYGGGVYGFRSDLIIDNSVFSLNECNISSIGWRLGGGLCCEVGTLNISNCLFEDNYTELGGGIYLADVDFPEIYSCVFVGNIADFGGGIQTNVTTDCIIYECLLINNFAEYGGGIFYAGDVNLDIVNCTIHGNVADSLGGGIYGETSYPDFTNLIIMDNYPDQINKYSGEPDITFSDIEGGWPGEGNIDSDPLFVEPDSLNFNLLAESPCINTGDPSFGVPPGGGRRIDMGACEYWFGWNISKYNFAD